MRIKAFMIILGLLIFLKPLGAQTWTATKRLTWNLNYSYDAAIAIDSSNGLHVVWMDETPGNREIYYKRSTDAGTTWTTKRLTFNTGDSNEPAIAAYPSDYFHVVWHDDSPGNNEIYYKRSSIGGSTKPTKRLTFSSGDSTVPAVAVDSTNHIHVVWEDDTPGNLEIFYIMSTDGGTSWTTTTRLTNNSGVSEHPSIAVDSNNHIHVVWEDWTPGDGEIYYKKSTDAGATWVSTKRLTWNSGTTVRPALAVDSNSGVHVVWQDSSPLNYEIFYRRSTDGGTSWDGVKRLTWNSGTSGSPSIVVDTDTHINVVWGDSTPGHYEIFYKKGIQ